LDLQFPALLKNNLLILSSGDNIHPAKQMFANEYVKLVISSAIKKSRNSTLIKPLAKSRTCQGVIQ
jgi:hypothetical protein